MLVSAGGSIIHSDKVPNAITNILYLTKALGSGHPARTEGGGRGEV